MAGFFSRAIWALHPLQTEAVIYITQRTELLVGLFYLATLYASLRYWRANSRGTRITWCSFAFLSCLAGMASKEVMVTAPVMVLLFELIFVAGTFRQALRKSAPLYCGLFASWGLLLALNIGGPRSGTAGFDLGISVFTWWLTQAKVLWLYLKLVIWPYPLVIHYQIPYLTSLSVAWPWLLGSMTLGLFVLVLVYRRASLGYVLAWVIVILSPTLLVPITTEVAAERRMYLPLAALVVMFVASGYQLFRMAQARFFWRGTILRVAFGVDGLNLRRAFNRFRFHQRDTPTSLSKSSGIVVGGGSERTERLYCSMPFGLRNGPCRTTA